MPHYEDPAKYYTPNVAALYPGVPPADAVMRVIRLWDGVARAAPACRLLDGNLNPYELPAPPNPYDPSNISPTPGSSRGYVTSVGMEWKAGPTDTSTQLTLSLLAFPGIGQFNTLTNYVRLYLQYYDVAYRPLLGDMHEVIYGPDGSLLPKGIPIGTFGFTIPDVTLSSEAETWDITGLDTLVELATLYPEHNYDAPAGMRVTDYVRTALMMDRDPPDEGGRQPQSPYVYPDPNNPGLNAVGCSERGPNIPASRIRLVPSDLTFPSAFRISYNEPWTAGLNRALASINYYPLDTDRMGSVLIEPMPNPAEQRLPDLLYETGAQSVIQSPVLVKINNQKDLANYQQVRCEDPTRAPMIAVAKNVALNSWISRPNIGKWRMAPPVKVDNVMNMEILQARANIELDLRSQGAESVDFSLWPDPLVTGHGLIGLHVWTPDGKELAVTSDPNAFIITNIKHDLDPSKPFTSLTVGRAVPL